MKNIISLTDFDKDGILQILDIATQMRKIVTADYKRSPHLLGCVLGGVWQKPCVSSTAFGLAVTYMSGTPFLTFGADAAEQLRAMDNMGVSDIVVSDKNDNLVKLFAETSRAKVINGGSGKFNPVAVLADVMALRARTDGLNGLNVLFVGNRDVNKVTELISVLSLFGSMVTWYLPPSDIATERKGIVLDNIQAAFAGVDAVIDLGLNEFCNPADYYGANSGIPISLMSKARVSAPLLGSKNVVDEFGIKEYPLNLVNIGQSCYVSVAMACLYLLHRN